MLPIPYFELDCFWESYLQVYLYADAGTRILIFWICLINVVPETVADCLERGAVPAMDGEVWKPHPDRDFFWDFQLRIKTWVSSVQVEALGAHEIQPVPEDQISIGL